jgi:tetraacyldisaccharide 4'-kinase
VIGPSFLHWILPILTGERSDIVAQLVTLPLAPLALLYALGLKAYLTLYTLGLRKRLRLPCCVVSVGNIVSGGTGKTGLTIALARGLASAGLHVCILSRGFRGSRSREGAVVAAGNGATLGVAEVGDEPFLMAQKLPGVPVIVGRDRRVTGRLAVERFRPDVIILDDGMQYYQLHRDVDIALVSASRPFGNGLPLPAGVLREPADNLRRASCIVVNDDVGSPVSEAMAHMMSIVGDMSVFVGRYVATSVYEIPDRQCVPLKRLASAKVATLCALGNPASFEATVIQTGATPVASYRLVDHRPPSGDEVVQVTTEAAELGAEAIVISAKDAVKWPEITASVPVWVLDAEFTLDDPEALLQLVRMQALVGSGHARR